MFFGERSPRTRGRRLGAPLGVDGVRTIPAHAGKTLHFLQSPIVPWNHPSKQRETKETNNYSVRYDERSLLSQGKGTDELVESQFEEQSPLTRGRSLRRVTILVTQGNIPAYAEKTGTTFFPPCCTPERSPLARGKRCKKVNLVFKNDPRTGGEDRLGQLGSRKNWERSPLARGRLKIYTAQEAITRKIAAHAGKSPLRQGSTNSSWNDPRVCGEDQ